MSDFLHRFGHLIHVTGPNQNDCWEWMGSKTRDGYGKVTIRGRKLYAHRVALVMAGTELQDGERVLHLCDNPSCCRPQHLVPGSQTDNTADMQAKGRGKGRWQVRVR